MHRSTGSYLRLLPAAIWVFIQLWMSATLAHAIPADAGAPGSHKISVIPCGGTEPIIIDLGQHAPDHPHGALAHGCDWCQSFGVSTLPAPASIPCGAALLGDANLKTPGAAQSRHHFVPSDYLSRAPPF